MKTAKPKKNEMTEIIFHYLAAWFDVLELCLMINILGMANSFSFLFLFFSLLSFSFVHVVSF